MNRKRETPTRGDGDELRRIDADAMEDDDLAAGDGDAGELAAERTRRRVRRVASQVYSVRVPVDRLEDLRQLAAARGEQPTAMLRRWVLERLDTETLGEDVVAPDVVGLPRGARAGTAADIGTFWPAASRRLLRLLELRGVDREQAEDIVQEVAVRALSSGFAFDGLDDFVWWAAPIVRNLHFDLIRLHKAAALAGPSSREQMPSVEPSVESIHDAIDSLTVALALTRSRTA